MSLEQALEVIKQLRRLNADPNSTPMERHKLITYLEMYLKSLEDTHD